MNKKAVELPVNTMIIIALALAVLIVFYIFFSKTSSTFAQNTISCTSRGGNCVPEEECKYEKVTYNCPPKQTCCINPLKGWDNEQKY